MIALIVIGGVLLFLFLLTLAPIRLELRFREEFSLKVKYLFLTFQIFPGKEEEPSQEEAPLEEEPEDRLGRWKAVFQKQGFWGFLEALFDFLKLLGSSSKRLLSHVKLKAFDLYLCMGGGEDAAAAALQYGEISTAVYSACGVLFGLLPCKKKAVSVDLQYKTAENAVKFSGKVSLRPLFAIREALVVLVKGLPFLKILR